MFFPVDGIQKNAGKLENKSKQIGLLRMKDLT